MKRIHCIACSAGFLLLVLLVAARDCHAQAAAEEGNSQSSKRKFGFRVGLNFAKVSGSTDSFTYHYKPGLMVAVFLSPPKAGTVGYKSEIVYSRQGFQYTDAKGNEGTVSNDYLMLPQMMTINITKFIQLQAGAFAGYLLRARDSGATDSNGEEDSYINLMNRIDFGAAGGLEITPVKGLIINGRYNMGFSKLYKKQNNSAVVSPGYFNPLGNIDTKNAVIQVSVGYQF